MVRGDEGWWLGRGGEMVERGEKGMWAVGWAVVRGGKWGTKVVVGLL